jgi:hypothetical protein
VPGIPVQNIKDRKIFELQSDLMGLTVQELLAFLVELRAGAGMPLLPVLSLDPVAFLTKWDRRDTPLGLGAIWTSAVLDASKYAWLTGFISCDGAAGSGTADIQLSDDGLNWDLPGAPTAAGNGAGLDFPRYSWAVDPTVTGGTIFRVPRVAAFHRFRYTNNGAAQSFFRGRIYGASV